MSTPARQKSLQSRILETVLVLGECSIAQVLAEVGRYIPAAQAAATGRVLYRAEAKRGRPGIRTRQRSLVERGRRQFVSDTLKRLVKRDKILRVRVGVYAPKGLQLFRAEREKTSSEEKAG